MRIKFFNLILLLSFFIPVEAQTLISDNQGLEINNEELSYFVGLAPIDTQKKLINSPKKTKKIAWDLYKLKALANKAKQSEFAHQKEVQFQLEKVINEFYAKLLLDEFIAKKLPNLDQLAEREYQVNKEKFVTDEMVDISHIQIKTECRSNEAAADMAKNLLAELKKGAAFDEMVMVSSEDKGKLENKGYLGQFKKGQMVEEFETAAFAMTKPGTLSDVIEYKDSFFIIRLNKRVPKKQKEFSEVKQEIIFQLRGKLLETRRDDMIAEIIEKSKVEFNEEEFNHFIKEQTDALEEQK